MSLVEVEDGGRSERVGGGGEGGRVWEGEGGREGGRERVEKTFHDHDCTNYVCPFVTVHRTILPRGSYKFTTKKKLSTQLAMPDSQPQFELSLSELIISREYTHSSIPPSSSVAAREFHFGLYTCITYR